jgi:hypothetical protein
MHHPFRLQTWMCCSVFLLLFVCPTSPPLDSKPTIIRRRKDKNKHKSLHAPLLSIHETSSRSQDGSPQPLCLGVGFNSDSEHAGANYPYEPNSKNLGFRAIVPQQYEIKKRRPHHQTPIVLITGACPCVPVKEHASNTYVTNCAVCSTGQQSADVGIVEQALTNLHVPMNQESKMLRNSSVGSVASTTATTATSKAAEHYGVPTGCCGNAGIGGTTNFGVLAHLHHRALDNRMLRIWSVK